jgi:spermidine synthase
MTRKASRRTAAFYASLRRHLKPRGLLVANISGHGLTADTHIELIDEVFDGRKVVVDVMSDGNRIVYAFNDPTFPPPWTKLSRSARELESAHPIEFGKLLRDMERSAQRARRKRR